MQEHNPQAAYEAERDAHEAQREEYEYDLFCSQNRHARQVNNDFGRCLAENNTLRAQLAAVKSELRDAYRDGNNRVDSLYAENARLKERCEALEALAEALEARNEHIQENGALMFGLDDDDLDDDLLCKIDTARARLAALGEGSV